MKLNKYFMLGLAGLAFAACSNEDDINPNADGGRVIRMSISREVVTKAADAPVEDQYVNSVADAIIFFTEGGGNIVYRHALTTEQITALNGSTHTAEVTCSSVPATALRAYVVANTAINQITGVPTTASGNTTTLNGLTTNLVEQNTKRTTTDGIATNATNTAQYTTLKGESTQDFTKTAETIDVTSGGKTVKEVVYTGEITLSPIVCRLEINGVRSTTIDPTATDLSADDVKSFTVEGIYINYFYPTGFLGGQTPASDTRINNGSDESKYNDTGYASYPYARETLNATSAAANGSTTSFQVVPTSGTTWARQLFPGEVPHIVVKLTNVLYQRDSGTTGVTKYLTVDSYAKSDGQSLGGVEAGKVYKISEILFDANDLTDIPYQTTKTIKATVTVAGWKAESLTPEFN